MTVVVSGSSTIGIMISFYFGKQSKYLQFVEMKENIQILIFEKG